MTLVLQGEAIARFAEFAADATPFDRVILVQPKASALNDDGLGAMIEWLRARRVLVLWAEGSRRVHTFVRSLQPKLPHAEWHALAGATDEFRGSRMGEAYPDPLPDGFAAAIAKWCAMKPMTKTDGER